MLVTALNSLIIGVLVSAIYGIFLSHREDSIRGFLKNLGNKQSEYRASTLVEAPIDAVWGELNRFECWHFWMFGFTFYEPVTGPLKVGSKIRTAKGAEKEVKMLSQPTHLQICEHEFILLSTGRDEPQEQTHFTYIYAVSHSNLLAKMLHMLSDGLLRVFTDSGAGNLAAARAEAFKHRFRDV
uniref:SRPBCC family protein n=1 Tax=Marinobacterium profundum TaxID=1714300 RepID=UPI00082C7914|nr:SRPBCC family protein [Marinobacterium profundum]